MAFYVSIESLTFPTPSTKQEIFTISGGFCREGKSSVDFAVLITYFLKNQIWSKFDSKKYHKNKIMLYIHIIMGMKNQIYIPELFVSSFPALEVLVEQTSFSPKIIFQLINQELIKFVMLLKIFTCLISAFSCHDHYL